VDARADATIDGDFPIYRGAQVTDTKGRLGPFIGSDCGWWTHP